MITIGIQLIFVLKCQLGYWPHQSKLHMLNISYFCMESPAFIIDHLDISICVTVVTCVRYGGTMLLLKLSYGGTRYFFAINNTM